MRERRLSDASASTATLLSTRTAESASTTTSLATSLAEPLIAPTPTSPFINPAKFVVLERTPFAIDEAGDDEDDDMESHDAATGGEDDARVMDEVDAFLEAHDSGLSEADKKIAKGELYASALVQC